MCCRPRLFMFACTYVHAACARAPLGSGFARWQFKVATSPLAASVAIWPRRPMAGLLQWDAATSSSDGEGVAAQPEAALAACAHREGEHDYLEEFLRPGVGSPTVQAVCAWVRAAPVHIDPGMLAIVRRWFPSTPKSGVVLQSIRVQAGIAGTSSRDVVRKNQCLVAAAGLSVQAWLASLCMQFLADVQFSRGKVVLQCVKRTLMTDTTTLPCWGLHFPAAGGGDPLPQSTAADCLSGTSLRNGRCQPHFTSMTWNTRSSFALVAASG